MTPTAYVLGVAVALLAFIVVLELIRRRRLRERHAIWWLVATALAVLAGIFPGAVAWIADAAGVVLPANLIFFVSIGVLALVCIQQSVELTELESETRVLAERVAILEVRVSAQERDTHD
ncbi:hypothetical protein J2X85_002365 [Microbacterium trichothecenolyticum]|uniref:DUF2304 domain-containing protein n=1 Tax=Microbacterium trichothecenolyticum TaxID=69370 RepID=UPI00286264F8|nr:DUF2304 domain-containing protein [Microbacterium trichothecenolyticum]MDR7185331.1 hypothetical protein [Microbacterium trichothecenolyticum]